MQIDPKGVFADVQAIRKSSPLVHNITNYVVMESTANGLLAIGASPIMAHALNEVEDVASLADSLVLNIGTLSPTWVQAMLLAVKAAKLRRIPIVLDPVGAGATSYRTETAQEILKEKITAIRGNGAEIASLVGSRGQAKGVDSLVQAIEVQEKAKILALCNGCVVWMSGPIDVVTDGRSIVFVHNGHPRMTRVTGMGCIATALTGAFLAVNQNVFLGCIHAAVVMGIVGEIAAAESQGPGSFKVAFLDVLSSLSLSEIEETMRVESCGALC